MSILSSFSPGMAALTIFAYVVVSILGLTLMKTADHFWSIPFTSGVFFYGLGFMIWIFLILMPMPLSIAFPLAAGSLIVGTQLTGWFFLNEPIDLYQIVGITAIIGGIFLVYVRGVAS